MFETFTTETNILGFMLISWAKFHNQGLTLSVNP